MLSRLVIALVMVLSGFASTAPTATARSTVWTQTHPVVSDWQRTCWREDSGPNVGDTVCTRYKRSPWVRVSENCWADFDGHTYAQRKWCRGWTKVWVR